MDFFLAPDPSEGAFGPEVFLLDGVAGVAGVWCSVFVAVVLGFELK